MDDRNARLDELLTQLPRDVAVPRDLWPGIARGIARRPRHLRSFAIAASLTIASAIGALGWAMLLHGHEFDEPRDAAYRTARAELEQSFNERLALLEPRTRAKIEASLAIVRRAHDDIRQALAAQPADPVLERLFESTWHDEFELYDAVVRSTQPNFSRS